MKKIVNNIIDFFDKKIVTPITKLVLKITTKYDGSGKKIEKLLSYAGNENWYQYFVLAVFLFLWMNCNFMAVVLPYLEREPLIKYTDSHNITHINLSYLSKIGLYE